MIKKTMEEYKARVADRCEVGRYFYALKILEAQLDFATEKSLKFLKGAILEAGHSAPSPTVSSTLLNTTGEL